MMAWVFSLEPSVWAQSALAWQRVRRLLQFQVFALKAHSPLQSNVVFPRSMLPTFAWHRVVQTKNSPLAEYTDFRAHMSTDTEYLGQLDAHLEK